MSTQHKVITGVITHENTEVVAMTSLLFQELDNMMTCVYYKYPSEMRIEREFDLLIARELVDIMAVLSTYRKAAMQPPLIMHLVTLDELRTLNYRNQFPNAVVIPLQQASLDILDTTLQLDAFAEVVEDVYRRKQGIENETVVGTHSAAMSSDPQAPV
jgi:hypothetical protein